MSKKEWSVDSVLYTAKVGKALWMLTEPMLFTTPRGEDIVPRGFLFDHASVPRLFTSLVPPVKSAIAEPSVWHDWWYNKDSENLPRGYVDIGLRELIKANRGSNTLANAAYAAVLIGGKSSYNVIYYKEKIKTKAYPEYQNMSLEELQELILI